MTDELWRRGASDLADAIRSKEVKSREVIEAHLKRIDEVNPRLNAVVNILADEALAAADAADELTAAGADLPPLHGVPMTVKENIDLVGSPTTQGLPEMADVMPQEDAPHIKQMKAAGAVPIGRTNLPDLGFRWHTDNDLRGATINPWDAERTPGGSSGGEAAALATGMSPLGMGNDYGGSLRWPSQCCGTAAIRPTLGRVPYASSIEPFDSPVSLQMFAVQGPMAREVKDLRLALSCMSGPDARDPWWTPAPLKGPAVERPIRVAVCADPGGMGVNPEVARGVRKAADALSTAGYQVEEVDPPIVAEANALWWTIVMTEIGSVHMPFLEQVASADLKTFLDAGLENTPRMDQIEYTNAWAERNGVARQWGQFLERYPLILGPVFTINPPLAGFDLGGADDIRTLHRAVRLTVIVNMLGLPSAAVPVGVENGLPQGVQIIGSRYREDLCLDAAQAVEDALGVITPIDPKN